MHSLIPDNNSHVFLHLNFLHSILPHILDNPFHINLPSLGSYHSQQKETKQKKIIPIFFNAQSLPINRSFHSSFINLKEEKDLLYYDETTCPPNEQDSRLRQIIKMMYENQKKSNISRYYEIPTHDKLLELEKKGQLMPLVPDMALIDNHLKAFNDHISIVELVESNKTKNFEKTQEEYKYKEKWWMATFKGYRRKRDGWNKLEIRFANDGFQYTKDLLPKNKFGDIDTNKKLDVWHNRTDYFVISGEKFIKQIPFLVSLSGELRCDMSFLYNFEDRRMEIQMAQDEKDILALCFEPGYPINVELLAQSYYKYYY